jgi:C-terminal processing protease CtpA/Prc
MAGLIGPDILERFIVTFDYSRRQILLEKSKNFARVDSYDRAGVWMGKGDKGFFAVDVIAGGPADEAGIRKGDRLLTIDGVSTEKLVLPEVRERMRRGEPGSRVTIMIEHDGVRRIVEVRLRDLV